MKISIANKVLIQEAPKTFLSSVKDHLTFDNPKWIENSKRGFWNGDTTKRLECFEQTDSDLLIPRGYIQHLLKLARTQGIRYILQDRRRTLPEVNFTFHGELRPFQKIAVPDILSREFGVLSAPTGSGKTCMALYVIGARRQPTLIVVHRKDLLNQWRDRIETFLECPKSEIGVIGNSKHTLGTRITVATVQSLYKCADEVKKHIGFLVVDECHRTPSRTFTEAVSQFDSRYLLGLSATPWRRDKLSRLIYWSLGDIVHKVDRENLLKTRDILPVEVIRRETDFDTLLDASKEYSSVISELTKDAKRNSLIAQDVSREVQKGKGICLVLSDRKTHCEAIKDLLRQKYGEQTEVLTGSTPKKKRQTVIKRLEQGKVSILIATGQLIGEGFDCKNLTTLFLATPIRFSGRVIQYLGRVLRPAPGKEKAVVYDYVDRCVGPLEASAKARMQTYLNAA